jgi:predicted DsbA family dithiol-disulfide isomerase
VSIVLYEDPLSPWCLVAERRILAALDEVTDAFGPLRIEPFPLRFLPSALSRRERLAFVRDARRAAREPEAAGTTPELWLSRHPPHSTLPGLAALAAARAQGPAREVALREAMRDAALVRGLDATRRDVLLELASTAGLDVPRFDQTLTAATTEKRVLAAVDEALSKGIEEAPALVVGDEWLVTGARTAEEYLTVFQRYAETRLGLRKLRVLH